MLIEFWQTHPMICSWWRSKLWTLLRLKPDWLSLFQVWNVVIFTSTVEQVAFYLEQFNRPLLCLAPCLGSKATVMNMAYEEFIPFLLGQEQEWMICSRVQAIKLKYLVHILPRIPPPTVVSSDLRVSVKHWKRSEDIGMVRLAWGHSLWKAELACIGREATSHEESLPPTSRSCKWFGDGWWTTGIPKAGSY